MYSSIYDQTVTVNQISKDRIKRYLFKLSEKRYEHNK